MGNPLNTIGSGLKKIGSAVGGVLGVGAGEEARDEANRLAAQQAAQTNKLLAEKKKQDQLAELTANRDASRIRARLTMSRAGVGGRASTILTGPDGTATAALPGSAAAAASTAAALTAAAPSADGNTTQLAPDPIAPITSGGTVRRTTQAQQKIIDANAFAAANAEERRRANEYQARKKMFRRAGAIAAGLY